MKAELIDTSASTVRNELTRMCQKMGGLTTGVVLNLIIMTDEADQYDAMRAATHAGREHPCQILGVIARTGRRSRRLDAEITVGESKTEIWSKLAKGSFPDSKEIVAAVKKAAGAA